MKLVNPQVHSACTACPVRAASAARHLNRKAGTGSNSNNDDHDSQNALLQFCCIFRFSAMTTTIMA